MTGQHPATLTATFQPDVAVLAEARRFGRRSCGQLGVSDRDCEAVVLVLNELAANAIMHARTSFEIRLSLDGGALRIAVLDENPRLPQMPLPAELATSGRGLALVSAVAEAWTVRTTAVGKEVAVEVPLHRAPGRCRAVAGAHTRRWSRSD